jgi:hypothetical protein
MKAYCSDDWIYYHLGYTLTPNYIQYWPYSAITQTECNLSYKPLVGDAEANSASNVALASIPHVYIYRLAMHSAAWHGESTALSIVA